MRYTRSPESAVALARIAAKRVEELYRIDATLDGLREHLKSAELSLQEAAYALRDYLSGLEANPGRLEEVETRLEAIARLKRKYGQSIAEILAFLEEVRAQIAGVESAGERMEALRKEQKRLAAEFEKAGARIDGSAQVGGAPPGEAGRGGTGATGDGAYGVPRGDGGGGMVRGRSGPRGVSGVAERGRGAASRWKRWRRAARFRASRWR